MKRFLKIGLLIVFCVLLLNIDNVFAETKQGYVTATGGLKLRKNAGTSYSIVTTLSYNTIVTINSEKKTADSSTGCPSGKWYNVTVSGKTGYSCTSYIAVLNNSGSSVTSSQMASMTDAQFKSYLQSQGFSGTYITKLTTLHKSHPNWIFKGVNAKYTWSNALTQQQVKGRSLYQVTSTGVNNGLQGYLATGSDFYNYATDKFKAYDGSTWFQANEKTIAYYMDPRNFLTETGIFMFEDLTYYSSYQTEAVVKKILYTDFYKNLTKYYIQGASENNVSPVYLAALSRQEVGLNSSKATSGKAGTYNGVNYDGYYNFYNIGASSGSNPVYNGLAYAKKVGWTTQQKSIVGGAAWIVSGYISKGQYTRYFQKWNVAPTTTSAIYHQYMTDIHALVSPSATTAASYNSMGISNEAIVFTIPVYSGMPSSTSLPPTGNPNNWLKTLKVDNTSVKNFAGSTTSYDLGEVDNSKTSINIAATTVNSKASISGSGNKNLSVGKNTFNVVVTAQNGSKKTYTLTVTRKSAPAQNNTTTQNNTSTTSTEPSISKILSNISIKNNNSNLYGFSVGTTASNFSQKITKQNSKSIVKINNSSNKTKTGALATGDKITITSNSETKTYQVIIYGDINGDGKISALDLLTLDKYLSKGKKLSGAYLEAAKINKKSSVTAIDLLKLDKYLLGKDKISQV